MRAIWHWFPYGGAFHEDIYRAVWGRHSLDRMSPREALVTNREVGKVLKHI